ncbi:MAG: RloB domain-containing protein [Gammaproteobacteria bacterium]|nr:RloB domain-containing protein [Gammaproteobacteria bacterium]MYK28286.1 RloB domain-containing protein [Gammaproteobacteria bacterium]
MGRPRPVTRRKGTRQPRVRVTVVTEGKSTEPAYLRKFQETYDRDRSVKLTLVCGAGDPRAVVERAIKEAEKLKGDRLAAQDSVWAMFDRDAHHRFHEARDLARGNRIWLAVSDPCFELWGIFHYRDYDAPLHRNRCQRILEELCSGYSVSGQKIFDDQEAIAESHLIAVNRARRSVLRREEEGSPEGNPSTTVHLLTERIRSHADRFRNENHR